jgi:hypothetical protein
VLSPDAILTGHDSDLVGLAGCPHARTAEELVECLDRMLADETYRRQLAEHAEGYVSGFCAAFGRDSAELIAETVRRSTDACPAGKQGENGERQLQ